MSDVERWVLGAPSTVLYLLCTVKVRAVHWEVTGSLRNCQRFVGKRKEITKKQAEGCRLGWVEWIYPLDLYTESIFKVIQQSLLFSHVVGVTAFYYTGRFDRKIGGKTGYRKFHPQYTWNGGEKPNWGCQKVFKELYKQNKTKQLLSYLSQSSMENNNMAFKLHSLCWGRCLKKKVYSVVSHILIGHNMKQKFKMKC